MSGKPAPSLAPRSRVLENNCSRTALHIFITAATTLLVNSISNPSNPLVFADLKLLEPFLKLLELISRSVTDNKVKDSYQSSIMLFEQAKMAVEYPGEAATYPPMKGGDPGARESVEDFLGRMERLISGDDT